MSPPIIVTLEVTRDARPTRENWSVVVRANDGACVRTTGWLRGTALQRARAWCDEHLGRGQWTANEAGGSP